MVGLVFHTRAGRFFVQDAEKARQLRSRIVQTLNVPQRVRLGPSFAAALLAGFLSILRTDVSQSSSSSQLPHRVTHN